MNGHVRTVSMFAVFAGGVVLGQSCKSNEINEDHCVRQNGDETCRSRYPGEFEFCGGSCVDSENNDGCVAEQPDDDCWYPCGNEMTAEDDMSCVGTTETETNASTMDSTDTDPSGSPTTADETATTMGSNTQATETDDDTASTTESGGDCQTSADCTNPDFPVCLDNDCVPCTGTPDGDMACNAKDENVPVCRDDGQCVQCSSDNAAACTGETPICDDGASTCVGCTYHEQCADTACNLATGGCIDGVVFHVDGDGGCSNAGPGNEGNPFCDIQVGIDAAGTEGVVIVHPAGSAYSEDLQVSGLTVAVLHAEGEAQPVVQSSGGGNPTLLVTGATTQAFVEGLRFSSNTDTVAVSLADGEAWLDRVEVVANSSSGSGVEALGGAKVYLRSSIVSRNGEDGNPATFGFNATGAGTELHLVGVTAAGNLGTAGSSLRCDGSATVTVRNSIVAKPTLDSIGCAGASVTYSSIDTDLAGTGVVVLGEFDTDWFELYFSNNLHLSADGETQFADVALVEAGDYPFDVDGDSRPAAGAMDHAGADTP